MKKKIKKISSFIENSILTFIYKYKIKFFYYQSYNLFKNYNAKPVISGYQLQIDSPLGEKGDILYLPADLQQGWALMKYGRNYDFYFLNLISKKLMPGNDYIFIDIGANAGLVTLELLRKNLNIESYICLEPVNFIYECLKLNTSKFNNITTYNFALSEYDDVQKIYMDTANFGNSSLDKSMMHFNKYSNFYSEDIQVKSVKLFFEQIADKIINKNLIIKIDTQGYDELIFSLLPDHILRKTILLCYELSLSKEYNKPKIDIKLFSKNLKYFNKIESKKNITNSELKNESIDSFDELINITEKGKDGKRFEQDIYLSRQN